MTGPNMAAITASLERSLQSFSLNHHNHHNNSSGSGGEGGNFSGSAGGGGAVDVCCQVQSATSSSEATLELNSNITLPYHWEQCLDLKTGEVYYINWRTGMKSKEDPRSAATVDDGGYFYSDDEDDDEYESEEEGSSVESSSRKEEEEEEEKEEDGDGDGSSSSTRRMIGDVLVVAGCKGCFMYFMVPKQVEDCPKCCGQLLHFDRSDA